MLTTFVAMGLPLWVLDQMRFTEQQRVWEMINDPQSLPVWEINWRGSQNGWNLGPLCVKAVWPPSLSTIAQ